MDLREQQKYIFSKLYKSMKFFQMLMLVSVISLVVIAPFMAKEMSENKVVKKDVYAELSAGGNPELLNDLRNEISIKDSELTGKERELDRLRDSVRILVRQNENLGDRFEGDGTNPNEGLIDDLNDRIKDLQDQLNSTEIVDCSDFEERIKSLEERLKRCQQELEEANGGSDCSAVKERYESLIEKYKQELAECEKENTNQSNAIGISGYMYPGQSMQLDKATIAFTKYSDGLALMESKNARGFPKQIKGQAEYELSNGQVMTFVVMNPPTQDFQRISKVKILGYAIK